MSLAPVLMTSCRARPPETGLTGLTRLEMMVAVKVVGSSEITGVFWRKHKRPGCSVNRRINKNINRTYSQTTAQDVPHQPFSQTLIILDDNSAFTVGKLLLNGCGCAYASAKLLLFYSSLYASVCLPGKLSLYTLPSLCLGSSALLCELFFG